MFMVSSGYQTRYPLVAGASSATPEQGLRAESFAQSLRRPISTLHRPRLLHQQRQRFIQLESVAGGIGEEESALSNKASSLDSMVASRLFSFSSRSISFSISFVRLSLSCSRLSLSSALIFASMVGCQFNFANKRRHGGKEERNSDLLIDLELEESEEIDMAVGGEKGDQGNQQACR